MIIKSGLWGINKMFRFKNRILRIRIEWKVMSPKFYRLNNISPYSSSPYLSGFTYRANSSFGKDPTGRPQVERFGPARGIQTSFRWGPIEVFLIDPRWFSRTEPSWADPALPGCIGKAQWEWLRTSLKASRAPFKALATGMIWDDKKNSEKDDWE